MIIKILFLIALGVMPFILESEDFFYWIVLIVWLSLYWVFKISTAKSLLFTLVIFLVASLLKLFGIYNVAEYAFRISLISLIIGISQAVFELR